MRQNLDVFVQENDQKILRITKKIPQFNIIQEFTKIVTVKVLQFKQQNK